MKKQQSDGLKYKKQIQDLNDQISILKRQNNSLVNMLNEKQNIHLTQDQKIKLLSNIKNEWEKEHWTSERAVLLQRIDESERLLQQKISENEQIRETLLKESNDFMQKQTHLNQTVKEVTTLKTRQHHQLSQLLDTVQDLTSRNSASENENLQLKNEILQLKQNIEFAKQQSTTQALLFEKERISLREEQFQQQNEQYINKETHFLQEINFLQLQMRSQTNDNEILTRQCLSQEQEIENLKNTMQQNEEAKYQLFNQINLMQEQINEYQRLEATSKNEICKLNLENRTILAQSEIIKRQLTDTQDRVITTNEDLTQMNQKIYQLQSDNISNEQTRNEIQQIRQEYEMACQQNNQLLEVQQQFQAEVQALQEQNQEIGGLLEQTLMLNKQQQLIKSQQDCEKCQDNLQLIHDLQQQVANLEQEIQIKQSAQEKSQESSLFYEQKYILYMEQVEMMSRQLEEANAACSKLEMQMNEANAKYAKIQQQSQQAASISVQYQAQAQQIQAQNMHSYNNDYIQILQLQSELADSKNKNIQLDKQIANITQQTNDLQNKNDELKQQINELQVTIKSNQSQMQRADSTYKQNMDSLQKVNNENQTKLHAYQTLQIQNGQLKSEKEQTNQQIIQLQKVIDGLQSDQRAVNSKMAQIQILHEQLKSEKEQIVQKTTQQQRTIDGLQEEQRGLTAKISQMQAQHSIDEEAHVRQLSQLKHSLQEQSNQDKNLKQAISNYEKYENLYKELSLEHVMLMKDKQLLEREHADCAKNKQKVIRLKSQLHDLKEQNTTLENEFQKIENELQLIAIRHQEELQNLHERLCLYNNEKEMLISREEEQQKERTQLYKNCEIMQQKIISLSQRNQEADEQLSRHAQLQSNYEQLENVLRQEQIERTDKQRQIDALQKCLNEAQFLLEQRDASLQASTAQYERKAEQQNKTIVSLQEQSQAQGVQIKQMISQQKALEESKREQQQTIEQTMYRFQQSENELMDMRGKIMQICDENNKISKINAVLRTQTENMQIVCEGLIVSLKNGLFSSNIVDAKLQARLNDIMLNIVNILKPPPSLNDLQETQIKIDECFEQLQNAFSLIVSNLEKARKTTLLECEQSNESMRIHCQQLEKKIIQLTDQLTLVQHNQMQTIQEIHQAQKRNEELECQIQRKDIEIGNYSKELEQTRYQADKNIEAFAKAKSEQEVEEFLSLKQDYNQKIVQLEGKYIQLCELQLLQQKRSFDSQIAQVTKQKTDLQIELERETQKYKNMISDLKLQYNAQLLQLSDRKQVQQGEDGGIIVQRMQDRVDKMENQILQSEHLQSQQLNLLQQELENTKMMEDGYQIQISQLQQQNQALQDQNLELQGNIVRIEQRMASEYNINSGTNSQSQMQQFQQQIDMLEQQAEEQAQTCAKYKLQLSRKDEQFQKLNDRFIATLNEQETLMIKYAKAAGRIERLEKQQAFNDSFQI